MKRIITGSFEGLFWTFFILLFSPLHPAHHLLLSLGLASYILIQFGAVVLSPYLPHSRYYLSLFSLSLSLPFLSPPSTSLPSCPDSPCSCNNHCINDLGLDWTEGGGSAMLVVREGVVRETGEAVAVETKRLCELGLEEWRRGGLGVTSRELEG